MINEVDLDGNGTVEFAEFVILMTNKVKEMTKEDEVYEAFMVLDKEKDDFISEKELKYFMRKVANIKLSSEEAKAMIEFADSDGDGLVSYDDFKSVIEMFQSNNLNINVEGSEEDKESEEAEDSDDSDISDEALKAAKKEEKAKLAKEKKDKKNMDKSDDEEESEA